MTGAPARNPPLALLAALLFATGAASLAAEVVWGRILLRSIGSTSWSFAALTAGILGGLGAGAVLGEHILRRMSVDALRAFGAAEVAGACCVLAFPSLSGLLEVLPGLVAGGAALAVVVVAALAIPWGASLPFAVAAVPALERGRALPVLYGWNALGGAAGSAAAGIAGIPLLGESGVSVVAATVGASVGVGAIALAPGSAADPRRSGPVLVSPVRPGVWIFVFLAGFTVLYWEVLWTRILALTAGATVYTFSLIAASVLLGIGAGSLLVSGSLLRRELAPLLPLVVALLFVICWSVVPSLPDLYLAAVRMSGAPPLVVGPLGAAAAVFLPNVLLGSLFPSMAARFHERLGSLYGASSAGAIAGAFLGGPAGAAFLGLGNAYAGGVLALMALSVAFGGLRLWPEFQSRQDRRLFAALPFVALPMAALVFVAPWEPLRILSGVYQWSPEDLASLPLEKAMESRRILTLESGRDVIVSVELDAAANTVYVRGNGKVEGSVPLDPTRRSLADMPTQTLLGEIPGVLLGGPERRFLLIGLGSGVTAGALERSARGGTVEVIEIEDAYRKALAHPAARKHLAAYLPRGLDGSGENFRLHIGDARRLLAADLGDRRWDAIVSQPSEPWLPGAAPLFTIEFFEMAARRLEPGGAFFQWLQIYKLDLESVRLVVRTFRRVFPRVFILRPPATGELILVGSAEALPLEKLLEPPLLEWAGLARIEVPADRLAAVLAGPGGVDRWVGLDPALEVNTDGRGELQYRVTGSLYTTREGSRSNLASLREIAGGDPVTRYLPAPLRDDGAVRRLLAARNARIGDDAEALAMLEGDLSGEAEEIREAIRRRQAGRTEGGAEEKEP